jgi:iron complex transport system ATP-binding protein
MIRAEQVSVRRGGKLVLDRVCCELRPGRLTVVLGPNGAGKSTLLRVLAGEFSPDAGEISFGGRPLRDWPACELACRRAVLPQESALQFPLRVSEVVLLGRAPHVRGNETRRDHAIAEAALVRVDLAAKRDRLFPSLSGGEKQRTQLARALAQVWEPVGDDTRVLLLDEPTASLDLAHQHATLRHARRLAGEGAAVLAILHELNLAMTYADDVWVLDGGELVAAGPVVTTLRPALIQRVFGVAATLLDCPGLARPHLVLRPPSSEDEHGARAVSAPAAVPV